MISTEQWRSRIGNWNGVLPSLKPKVGSCTSSESPHFAFDCDRTSFGGIYKAKDGAQKMFILNLKKFSWLPRVLICIQIVLFVYTLLLRSPQHINDSSSSTSSLFICTNSRNELCPGLGLVNCTTNYEPRTYLWLASKLSSSVVKYKLIMGNIETHSGPMTSSQQSSQPLILYLEDKKNIIEELVAKTDDDDIRQVISRYAPDKPANEIEQSLSEKKVTKDKMIKTIKFLLPDREVAETISKPQLIKETVFSIERLLPENCRYCNEVYATKHGIQPPLQCYHCKQGIHENCSKLVDIPEIPQIPGLIWLCGYCQPRVTFTASSTVYTGKATTSLGKTKSTPSVMSSIKNPKTTAEDNNKKRSHTQLDSRKQVIAFQDRVITINIKEAQHPLK